MNRLLASHGSAASIAAEKAAIAACRAGDRLDHLYVIPSWWSDMTGDDWLNNGVIRNDYRQHLENELNIETEKVSRRIQAQCRLKNINYQLKLFVGDSAESLSSLGHHYDTIYIGSRRPKGYPGVNDRMLTKGVYKLLQNRLEIIAFPNE